MGFDNRKAVRRKLDVPARLISGRGAPQHECVVLDISETGARLEIATSAEVPDNFTMVFTPQGEPFRQCKVVWRLRQHLGVTFDKKTPYPPDGL